MCDQDPREMHVCALNVWIRVECGSWGSSTLVCCSFVASCECDQQGHHSVGEGGVCRIGGVEGWSVAVRWMFAFPKHLLSLPLAFSLTVLTGWEAGILAGKNGGRSREEKDGAGALSSFGGSGAWHSPLAPSVVCWMGLLSLSGTGECTMFSTQLYYSTLSTWFTPGRRVEVPPSCAWSTCMDGEFPHACMIPYDALSNSIVNNHFT